jgi:hypothetical protein
VWEEPPAAPRREDWRQEEREGEERVNKGSGEVDEGKRRSKAGDEEAGKRGRGVEEERKEGEDEEEERKPGSSL